MVDVAKPRLLRTREAAYYLGMSSWTLRRTGRTPGTALHLVRQQYKHLEV